MKRRVPPIALVALPWFLVALDAFARAGGGHSYSGGHSSGGGGGGGGGGYSSGYSSGGYSRGGGDLGLLIEGVFRLFYGLIRLSFTYPLVGIPIDLLLIWGIYKLVQGFEVGTIDHLPSRTPLGESESAYQSAARAANARHRLEKLKTSGDPGFSIALFNDFIYALFAKVHQARGTHRLKDLAAFVSENAAKQLEELTPGLRGVQGVVVGSSTFEYVGPIDEPMTRVRVMFEANYTEETVDGKTQSWYARELWVFTRKKGVLSRTPEKSRKVDCPACGAPPARTPAGACPNCGRKVEPSAADWSVDSVQIRREERPPLLTSDVAEEGTGLPTLYDPEFPAERKIVEAMPGFAWDGFQKRALVVFHEIQKAWTERRWDKARPFETDNVFQTHYYWIAEYQRQKLVNALRDVKVARIVPVRIMRDQYYVSVTARIYASMIDCTQTENGKVVTGNPNRSREFTEYWTFIRSVSPKGQKAGDLSCPSCGAPLKIGMSGNCEYCNALVTSGEFDWVLSQIEQDESYAG